MLTLDAIPQFTGDADAQKALRADKYPTFIELVQECSVCHEEVNALYFDNSAHICEECMKEQGK